MRSAGEMEKDLESLIRFVLTNIDVDLPQGATHETVDVSGVDVSELIRCAKADIPFRVSPPPSSGSRAGAGAAVAAAGSGAAAAGSGADGDLPAVANLDDLLADEPIDRGGAGVATADAGPSGASEGRVIGVDRDEKVQLAYALLLDSLPGHEPPAGADAGALRMGRANLGLASRRHKKLLEITAVAATTAGSVSVAVPEPAARTAGPVLRLIASVEAVSRPLADAPLAECGFEDATRAAVRRAELLRVVLLSCFRGAGVGPSEPCVVGGERVDDIDARVEEECGKPAAILARFPGQSDFESFGGPAFEDACRALSAFARLCVEAAPPARGLPGPAATELYEVLLTSMFDAHENNGELAHGHEDILSLLRHYRAAAGVSDAEAAFALARVYHEVYAALGAARMLDRAMEALGAAVDVADGPAPLSGDAARYRGDVLAAVRGHAESALVDYRANFASDPDGIAPAADCYAYVCGLEDPSVSTSRAIASAVARGVRRVYAGLRDEAGAASTVPPAELAEFLESVVEEVDTDLRHFAPHFPASDELPSAAPLFAEAYLAEIAADVRLSLDGGGVRIDASAARVSAVLARLEEMLPADRRGRLLEPAYDVFRAALMDWVESKDETFSTFVARAISAETWMPVADAPSFSSSVVDMFAILSQTVPFVFEFRIPRLLPIVNTLAMKVDALVTGYAEAVARQVGTKARFVPPLPPFSMSKTKFGGLVAKKAEPPFITPETERIMAAQTLPRLFVRLNCLLECPAKLRSLLSSMEAQFENVRAARPDAGDVPLGELNLFEGAFATLEARAADLRDYIGAKIVFYDLRAPFLEGLYIPSPKQSRLLPVSDMMDPILESVMENVFYDHTREVISAIFMNFIACFRRVLLDGGPDRIFSTADALAFADDVNLIADLFMAIDEETGEAMGLPQGYVLANTAQVQNLIGEVFECSTKELIDAYPAAPEQDPYSQATKGNIFRALVHRRGDDIAKKWVHDMKKRLKLN